MENFQPIRDYMSLEHIDVLLERIRIGWLQRDPVMCRFVDEIKSLGSDDEIVEAEQMMVVFIFQGKKGTTASKSRKRRKQD